MDEETSRQFYVRIHSFFSQPHRVHERIGRPWELYCSLNLKPFLEDNCSIARGVPWIGVRDIYELTSRFHQLQERVSQPWELRCSWNLQYISQRHHRSSGVKWSVSGICISWWVPNRDIGGFAPSRFPCLLFLRSPEPLFWQKQLSRGKVSWDILSIRSNTKLRFPFLPSPSLKHVRISMYVGNTASLVTSLNLISGDQ